MKSETLRGWAWGAVLMMGAAPYRLEATKFYKGNGTGSRTHTAVGHYGVGVQTPNGPDAEGIYYPKITITKNSQESITTGPETWNTAPRRDVSLPVNATVADVLKLFSAGSETSSSGGASAGVERLIQYVRAGIPYYVAVSAKNDGSSSVKLPQVDFFQPTGFTDWGVYSLEPKVIDQALGADKRGELDRVPKPVLTPIERAIKTVLADYTDQVKVTYGVRGDILRTYALLDVEQRRGVGLIRDQRDIANIYSNNPNLDRFAFTKDHMTDKRPDPLRAISSIEENAGQKMRDDLLLPRNHAIVKPLVFHTRNGVIFDEATLEGMAKLVGTDTSTARASTVIKTTLWGNLFPVFTISRYPRRVQEKLVRSALEVDLTGKISVGDELRSRAQITALKPTSKGHYFAEVMSDVLNQKNKVVAQIKNGLMVLVGPEETSPPPPPTNSVGASIAAMVPPNLNYDFHRSYDVSPGIGKKYGELSNDRNFVHTDPEISRRFTGAKHAIQQGSLTQLWAERFAAEALHEKGIKSPLKKTNGKFLNKILEGDKIDVFVSVQDRSVLMYNGGIPVYSGSF